LLAYIPRMTTLLVMIGGALGAFARYTVGGWVQNRFGPAFPWATLFVNITAAFLLGVIVSVTEKSPSKVNSRAFLGIGFCGGYSTFSAFSYETMRQVQEGKLALATASSAANVVLTVFAVFVGVAVGGLFRSSARG
jgi:CrcB protein